MCKLRENQRYSVTKIIMIYSFMLHLRFLGVLVNQETIIDDTCSSDGNMIGT